MLTSLLQGQEASEEILEGRAESNQGSAFVGAVPTGALQPNGTQGCDTGTISTVIGSQDSTMWDVETQDVH